MKKKMKPLNNKVFIFYNISYSRRAKKKIPINWRCNVGLLTFLKWKNYDNEANGAKKFWNSKPPKRLVWIKFSRVTNKWKIIQRI